MSSQIANDPIISLPANHSRLPRLGAALGSGEGTTHSLRALHPVAPGAGRGKKQRATRRDCRVLSLIALTPDGK